MPREVQTMLFTDIVGSTQRLGDLGDVPLRTISPRIGPTSLVARLRCFVSLTTQSPPHGMLPVAGVYTYGVNISMVIPFRGFGLGRSPVGAVANVLVVQPDRRARDAVRPSSWRHRGRMIDRAFGAQRGRVHLPFMTGCVCCILI
jgi:hypothetical protein